MAGEQIIRSKSGIRGRDRKGIRARDFLVQATDAVAKVIEPSPEYDKPKTMIETMRIEGTDIMTARDKALYEFLLANARNNGIDIEWHDIDMKTMTGFLEVEHTGPIQPVRVRESLKRITQTLVTYDFRTETRSNYGSMPLILADISEDLLSGMVIVQYSIPAPVRAAILSATSYAMLQLNVFPKFSCRYSAGLYQRLAYLSALPKAAGKRWEVEPIQLAKSLSYPVDGKSLHFASFMKRAVEPALAEIADHVEAFTAELGEPIRGSGRGRPVEKLVFLISPTKRRMQTRQAARLSARELDVIGLPDDTLSPQELPSTLVVGRAATATGIDAITLSQGWRAVYERAKADPNAEVMPGLQGGFLVNVVEKSGVGAGFSMWSEMVAEGEGVPTHRTPRPIATASVAPPAKVSPPPSPEARLARCKEIARNNAADILDTLRGYRPGGEFKASFDATFFIRFCDAEVCPWLVVEPYVKSFGTLAHALKILRTVENERRRSALRNLAYAAMDWNLEQLMKIAGAIVAESHKQTAAPHSLRRPPALKGFIATREVTELSVETDFADPLYAAGAWRWDDREELDMEDDTACPF